MGLSRSPINKKQPNNPGLNRSGKSSLIGEKVVKSISDNNATNNRKSVGIVSSKIGRPSKGDLISRKDNANEKDNEKDKRNWLCSH